MHLILEVFELTEKVSFAPITDLSVSIFINPGHQKPHILLVKNDRVEIIRLNSGLNISSWRFNQSGYIRQIKLSTDFIYLGVLKSAKVLEIRTLYQELPVYEIIKDDKKSDSILGFEWVFPGELMVLSSDGVQFYMVIVYNQVENNNSKFSKQSTIKIRMNWYQYWPETKLLILSSGSTYLFIYRLSPKSSFETYPTLQLCSSSRMTQNMSNQITRLNVFLLSIHSHNYVGFLNNWVEIPTLSLYRITSRTMYRKEYELVLGESGIFSISVSDNLLIAHNMSNRVFIFDSRLLWFSMSNCPYAHNHCLNHHPNYFNF